MARKKPATAPSSGTADSLLDAVLQDSLQLMTGGSHLFTGIDAVPSGKDLLTRDRDAQAGVVKVSLDRLAELETKITAFRAKEPVRSQSPEWAALWNPRRVLQEALRGLLRRGLPLPEADVVRLLEWPAATSEVVQASWYPLAGIASAAEHFAESHEVSERLRSAIGTLVEALRRSPSRPPGLIPGQAENQKECGKIADRLERLLGSAPLVQVEAGEAWSDVALADLKAMNTGANRAWPALLLHCQTGGAGKCTDRWKADARPLIDAVGFDSFKDHISRWFPLVDKPRTQPKERQHPWEPDYDNLISDPHVALLRGLAWCCGLREDADLARAVAELAVSAYKTIPGKGPRLVSLGNACVTALAMMPGRAPIGQLAVLKGKITFGTAQKEVEKAFNAAATREGLTS